MDIKQQWITKQGELTPIQDTEVVLNGDNTLTLSVDPGVNPDALAGKTLTISGSASSDGEYTILHNDGVLITTEEPITETSEPESFCTVTFSDLELYNEIGLLINYLNSPVTFQIISYSIPTYNDYFKKIDVLIENVSNFISFYIDKTIPHNAIGKLQEVLSLDIDEYSSSVSQIQAYKAEISLSVGELNTIFSEVEMYFGRLKQLMTDFKIASEKIDDKPYLNYYNVRGASYQQRIDDLFDAYQTNGRDGFSELFNLYQEEIKIVRP